MCNTCISRQQDCHGGKGGTSLGFTPLSKRFRKSGELQRCQVCGFLHHHLDQIIYTLVDDESSANYRVAALQGYDRIHHYEISFTVGICQDVAQISNMADAV